MKEEIFSGIEKHPISDETNVGLAQKVGEFISTFRSMSNSFEEGVGITQRLADSAFKLTPLLMPVIAKCL